VIENYIKGKYWVVIKKTSGGVNMVYNETYASGDVAEVSIDLIVGLGAELKNDFIGFGA